MAKFVFKLQSFLNIKEKIEEQKRTEYGKAVSNLENEKLALQKIFENKNKTITSMQESINLNVNSITLKNFNDYLIFLDKEAIRQKKVIEEEKVKVEQARLELVEAIKQKKTIETLKEKHKEEYLKEELKKEQQIIDEIVSFKYNIQS